MKLYDSLQANGFYTLDPYSAELEHLGADQASDVLHEGRKTPLSPSTHVEITNVHQYLMSHHNEHWPTDTFPNVASPWPSAWFEWSLVRHSNSDGKDRDLGTPPGSRTGVLLTQARMPDKSFIASATVFVSYGDLKRVARMGTHAFAVTPQGKYRSLVGKVKQNYIINSGGPGVDLRDVQGMIDSACLNVYLALSFAHCKNVSLVEHSTPPKVAAKRIANGKPPGTTYKTLVIDGMKETLRTEGGVAQNGLKKALHICRGHFATYTPDRPLFGKVVGTVWKPMHTRGSKERGQVLKDYKVVANDK